MKQNANKTRDRKDDSRNPWNDDKAAYLYWSTLLDKRKVYFFKEWSCLCGGLNNTVSFIVD
jgi:hypothetical protein